MIIDFNQFNKDFYTELDDSDIGKYIPVAYGKIASVELTCINSNYSPDAQGVRPIYRMPDGMSDHGTAYLQVDDVWKLAEIYSVDYETGRIEILNGRSSSGTTYKCKLVDCYGYMFDGHSYPRQVLQHWFATYGGIQYTASNFAIDEWVSELDDSRVQADIGFLLDDYDCDDDSDDTYGQDYLWKTVFNISNKSRHYFLVDYNSEGKITARLKDYDRESSATFASVDIKNVGELPIETSKDNVYSKIYEKYYYDSVNDTHLSMTDNTYETYVKQNYRRTQKYTDETYLVNSDDATYRAGELALTFKDIPLVATLDLADANSVQIYDVITVSIMPDNLDSSQRKYAGNHDCLVIGTAPQFDQGYNELTCAIIPDRTPSDQQIAVNNGEYINIARKKSSLDLINDDITATNEIIEANLLLTGSLSIPIISLVADKDGNVTDYSDATGIFNVKYSGTDVTGDGPVYSVVSQTGCTGTIDATTGVYAISALSADVGILTLKATYDDLSFETSFTVTKSYTGETGDTGDAGINTATVYLYKQASSAPDVPTNTLTYTFATSVLSGTIDNGWLEDIPDSSSTLSTYRISAVAANNATTDTITTSEWSTPVIYAKLGTDGSNGLSISIDSQSVTYQSNSSGTVTPSGIWLNNPPEVTKGYYLWTRTIINYSDSTTTTAYSVSYIATNGTNGVDATSIEITDPTETTPQSLMVYDNIYYGMYGGQWYMWAWDSETTGYWTLTSATVPTDAVIHYSFDDMPDLPDASGADYYKDNDFTVVPSGWIQSLSTTSSFVNGKWLIENTTPNAGYYTTINGIVTIEYTLISGKAHIGFAGTIVDNEILGTHKKSFYASTNTVFAIYNYAVNGSITITKLYIGDGTTAQPIIDNVSGIYNANADGVLSCTGVSGRASRFFGTGYLLADAPAFTEEATFSFWCYLDNITDTMAFVQSRETAGQGLAIFLVGGVFRFDYNGAQTTFTGFTPSADTIYHLEFKVNTTQKKLVVNGELVATARYTYADTVYSDCIWFGLSGYSCAPTVVPFLGWIDDFQYFSRETDISESLGLYLARGNTQKLYSLADYQNRNIIVTYSITANNSAFSRSRSNVISPSTITVSAKQTKLGVLSAYSGRFIIYTTINGTSYASVYTSGSDEASHTYTLPTTGITGLRVELYKSGGTTTLLTSTDYSTPYAEDAAPMYLGLGAISTGTKAFVSATVDSNGVITPGSTISNIITGDWALGCVSTNPKTATVYYWFGSAWTATTAQTYVSAAAFDILNLTTGGYTVANYTIIVNAIIKNLMVSNMKLLAGGKIFSGTGTYGNSNTPIFLGYDTDGTAKFSLGNGLTFNGTDMAISTGGEVKFTGDLTVSGDTTLGGNLDLTGAMSVEGIIKSTDFSASSDTGFQIDGEDITLNRVKVKYLHARDEAIRASSSIVGWNQKAFLTTSLSVSSSESLLYTGLKVALGVYNASYSYLAPIRGFVTDTDGILYTPLVAGYSSSNVISLVAVRSEYGALKSFTLTSNSRNFKSLWVAIL